MNTIENYTGLHGVRRSSNHLHRRLPEVNSALRQYSVPCKLD